MNNKATAVPCRQGQVSTVFFMRHFRVAGVLLTGMALTVLAGCDVKAERKGFELQVSGRGEVAAVPDVAVINAGLQLQGNDSQALLARADELMTRVLAALEKAGIDKKHINAGQLSLQQRWQYSEGKRLPEGYEIRRPLTVSLDDIERYPAIIELLSEQGINTLNGVSFDYSSRQPLIDEAITKAVADASHQAMVIAKALDASSCKPIQISLGGSQVPVPRMEMAKLSVMADRSDAYNPGEQTLSADVSGSFLCE